MNKNDWIFLGIVVVLIVIVTSFIYMAKIKADSGLIKYKNSLGEEFSIFKFSDFNLSFYKIIVYQDEIQYTFIFRNSPYELLNISIEKGVENALNRPGGTRIIYATQDYGFPNITGAYSTIGILEFGHVLAGENSLFNMNMKAAYTDSPPDKNITIASCKDVSDDVAVIYLKEGDENRIYSENDCLILESKKEDVVKAADRFAYYLLGVMI